MTTVRLSLIALLAATPASSGPALVPHTPPPLQTIGAATEEVIVEKDQASAAADDEDTVSPDGRKVAWRAPSGQKWTVMVNGVAQGAAYEEVRSFTFSPDGEHLMYAARRDKRWMMVADGKEGATTYADVGLAAYSDDGRHLVFHAKPAKKWVAVLDGVTQASEFDAIVARAFSPDGNRLAYVGRRKDKLIVVLDGKEGVPFDIVGGIRFSGDSRRFAYAGADVHQGFGKQKAVGRVVIDGTAGAALDGRQIGSLLKSAATGSTPRLILGYFQQLDSETYGVSSPVFSPDSMRVAYGARRGKDDSAVMLDGEAGATYPSILAGPAFSADSRHIASIVAGKDAPMLVVDGATVPSGAPDDTDFFYGLTFAPDHRRVAYVGVKGGSLYDQGFTVRARRRVYVDGVAGPEYNARALTRLQFTVYGRHLLFVTSGVSENSRTVAFVVADGAEGKRYDYIYGDIRVEGASFSYTAQAGRKFLRVRHVLVETSAN
jgi:hypothetical protein